MDFAFTEDQEALRQLAHQIFADHCTHERCEAVEATPEWFHRGLWDDLAKANLLGVALPEDVGGSGLGVPRARAAARGAGTRGGAGAALADAGARRRCRSTVRLRGAAPAVAAGRRARRDDPHRGAGRERLRRCRDDHRDGAARRQHLAARRRQDLRAGRAPRGAHPRAGAHRRRGGRRVPGRSACGGRAAPARDRDQRRAAVRAPAQRRHGRRRRRARRSARRRRHRRLDAAARHRGAVRDQRRRRRRGAAHDRRATLTNRKQFGKALATFQAVAQRAADAFIEVEACAGRRGRRLAPRAAATPRTRTSRIAKFWAAEGGHFAHLRGAAPARRHGPRPRLPRAPLLHLVESRSS